MTVKSSISLTDEQAAYARALVKAGRYTSVSAVLQQGLELLRRKTDGEEVETEALRALLQARRDGDFISGNEMARRIDEIAERKRRAHGV